MPETFQVIDWRAASEYIIPYEARDKVIEYRPRVQCKMVYVFDVCVVLFVVAECKPSSSLLIPASNQRLWISTYVHQNPISLIENVKPGLR